MHILGHFRNGGLSFKWEQTSNKNLTLKLYNKIYEEFYMHRGEKTVEIYDIIKASLLCFNNCV